MEALDRIRVVLKEQIVLSAGFADTERAYVCLLFYVFDGKSIYYRSKTSSYHSELLKKNPKISFALYRDASTHYDKIGIQGLGEITKVSEYQEVEKVAKLFQESEDLNHKSDLLPTADWLVGGSQNAAIYRIDIEKVKLIDAHNPKGMVTEWLEWK